MSLKNIVVVEVEVVVVVCAVDKTQQLLNNYFLRQLDFLQWQPL